MTRTTDEINAMTLAELRAAVAVDLLGWEEAQDGLYWHQDIPQPDDLVAVATIPHCYRDIGQDWLGVVDDAMIARGWEPSSEFDTDSGTWTVEFWRWDDGSNTWLSGKDTGPNREGVALAAVLLALAAEAAAKTPSSRLARLQAGKPEPGDLPDGWDVVFGRDGFVGYRTAQGENLEYLADAQRGQWNVYVGQYPNDIKVFSSDTGDFEVDEAIDTAQVMIDQRMRADAAAKGGA